MFLNLNVTILIKGKTLEAFPLKSGTKQEFPLQSLYVHFLKALSIKHEKLIRNITIRKDTQL